MSAFTVKVIDSASNSISKTAPHFPAYVSVVGTRSTLIPPFTTEQVIAGPKQLDESGKASFENLTRLCKGDKVFVSRKKGNRPLNPAFVAEGTVFKGVDVQVDFNHQRYPTPFAPFL